MIPLLLSRDDVEALQKFLIEAKSCNAANAGFGCSDKCPTNIFNVLAEIEESLRCEDA